MTFQPLTCTTFYYTTLFPLFFLSYELAGVSYISIFIKSQNSVDPDQLASQKPADLDLHCFQNRIIWVYSMVRVNLLFIPKQ